jgi:1,4-dihydroxy-2-naphthoyl-CoA hydrolase
MALWFGEFKPIDHKNRTDKGLNATIGLEIFERGDDYLRGRMPVDDRTRQPYGILHGGASCVLAETLASMGSALVIDQSRQRCVGLELNANHIRGVSSGWVIGTARPLHVGRTTHVWDVRIESEEGKLVCVARVTMAILDGGMPVS